ncbi:SMC family ATPase [Sphingobacterium faecium]|uniref:SMC family ATPase n=1 Tax=Sphingobacterium faecium TaxID=34087 RepID=UPI00246863ED|nr:SMC family ATPase [Sphingobacterium faecium]MDH5826617.1 SMC family ATPase [Sphingobacterium faecium]
MLPLYLSIEGLYSYQTKQEIDFTSLTAAGLFGIFGKVGSGKSTVLEAITFALFANTNRLNTNNRAYNMMNLNSNQLRIEFHFIGKENKKYAFEASWRRNSKQFEKVTTPIRKAYVFENGEKIPLESTDAEEILGISYKNFNRTVIVPQGQFKEFLELKGAERSAMMKELFNLDHYDLFYKVASLNKETDLKIQNISGAVQILDEYTAENIEGLVTQLSKEESTLALVSKKHANLDQQYQKLLEVQLLYREIASKKEIFAKLNANQDNIATLKRQIQVFRHVERIFKYLFEDLRKDHQVAIQLQTDTEHAQKQMDGVSTKLLITNQELTKTELLYNKLDSRKIEVEDLKNIIQILQLQHDIASDTERIAKGQVHLHSVEKEIADKLALIQDRQFELKQLKLSRIPSDLLIVINDWYSKQEQLVKNQRDIKHELTGKQTETQTILQQFLIQGLDSKTWLENLSQKETLLSIELEKLQIEANKALVQQQLATYTHALTNGQACPLCGSEQHPHIMQTEDVSMHLDSLKSQKVALLAEVQLIQQQKQYFIQVETNLISLKKDVETLQAKLQILLTDQQAHLNQFIWEDFTPHDRTAFEKWKLQVSEIEKKCTAAEDKLTELQNEQEILKGKRDKYNNVLNSIILSKSTIEGRLTSHLQLIKQLNVSDYHQLPLSDIENRIVQSIKFINDTEQSYKKLSDEVNRLNVEEATCSTATKSLKLQLSGILLQIDNQQKQINDLLKQHNYSSAVEVQQILAQQLDLDKEETRIKQFEEQYAIIQAALLQLEEKVQQEAVDISQITAISLELQQVKQDKEKLIGQLQSLKDQVLTAQKKYAEKLQLQVEFDKLNLRSKNLNVLSNLFKGNGFVDYISTQYLEDLCLIANQRFERLTRGHLKLMINADNDFEVIDHLNGGKSRSVRTLSGGQFFQASLCLALALAESTRSLNKNEKNFFFIDEGFGTQDTESVNLIFETLNSLHKENRIVGIISHVDELQERIPASIKIVKDEHQGSLVVRNH